MLLVEEKDQLQKCGQKGSGNIHVNGLKMNEYFKRPVHQIIVTRLLEISDVSSSYDVKCCKRRRFVWSSRCNYFGYIKSINFHDENPKKFKKRQIDHQRLPELLSVKIWSQES